MTGCTNEHRRPSKGGMTEVPGRTPYTLPFNVPCPKKKERRKKANNSNIRLKRRMPEVGNGCCRPFRVKTPGVLLPRQRERWGARPALALPTPLQAGSAWACVEAEGQGNAGEGAPCLRRRSAGCRTESSASRSRRQ